MNHSIEIGNLRCLCNTPIRKDRIAYILYPMEMLALRFIFPVKSRVLYRQLARFLSGI